MKSQALSPSVAVAAAAPMPAGRPSFYVPLSKLVLAEDQVRKTPPTEAGIAQMAAMLLSQGQLNALQVTPDPESARHFVRAGGRRLRGFELLAKSGKIAADFPVECKELESDDATAVGLMENISQEAMHPADEFTAFLALAEQGRSVESIAAQYGVTLLHVQRRLKLAGLAPELMILYRDGEILLDQVMALVQLDDQQRQVLLFKGLPKHNRSAHAIRRLIAEDEVPVSDARVKFVGLKVYLEAGGGIRSDLFADKGERFLTDPLLLEMLVGEAFETVGSELRAQGWKWIDIHPDYTYTERNQYFQMPQKRVPESPEQMAKRTALEAEFEALQERHDVCEDEMEIDDLREKMEAVEKRMQDMSAELVDTAGHEKDIAGVVLTIRDGKIQRLENLGRVSERKQIMAELAARQKRTTTLSTGNPSGAGEDATGAPDDEPVDAIPERLMFNLTSHRTAALQACMVSNQKVTLAALAQRMATSVFHDYRDGDQPIKISRTNAWHALEKLSPTVGTSLAAAVMTTERTRWEQILPTDRKTWLGWFIDQPLEVSLSMIVFGTAETVSAVQGRAESQDRAANLAKALDLDMRAWWEPTSENYLDLVPKSKLIAAVIEAKSAEWAKDMPKLKKPEAIAFSAEALAGTGWLPLPLRAA